MMLLCPCDCRRFPDSSDEEPASYANIMPSNRRTAETARSNATGKRKRNTVPDVPDDDISLAANLKNGTVIYIPASAFPEYDCPPQGFWQGIVLTNRPLNAPGMVRVKVPGERGFLAHARNADQWRNKPADGASAVDSSSPPSFSDAVPSAMERAASKKKAKKRKKIESEEEESFSSGDDNVEDDESEGGHDYGEEDDNDDVESSTETDSSQCTQAFSTYISSSAFIHMLAVYFL